MFKTLSLLAAALSAALLLSSGLDRCPAAETTTAEQKIEQELEKPTVLECVEMPLQDVIDYLRKRHGIEIQIDRKALDDVGLDPSTIPITKRLKGLSLRSALELTLHDLDLTYLVQDEVLLITTPEEAETRLTTKFYPVADLFHSGSEVQEKRRGDELVEAIAASIESESWDQVGGPGSITTTSFQRVPTLVVSQTYHVHRKIAAFLEEQRQVVQAGREAAVPRCPVVDIEMTPAAEKIAKALNQPTELSFIEAPLADVVDYLKKKHQIEIQIDRRALGDVGLDASTLPISKDCKGISLRSALRLLFRDLDLTYVIQDEVLLITTPEEAETRLTTRIYAVGDLLGSFPVDTRYFPVNTGVPVVGTWQAAPGRPEGSGPRAGKKADASVASVPQPSAIASRLATLADVITCTIEPDSWDQVGGPGSICRGWVGGVDVLIVSQTQDVHEQIGRLIEKLREFVRSNRSTAAPAVAKPTSDK